MVPDTIYIPFISIFTKKTYENAIFLTSIFCDNR